MTGRESAVSKKIKKHVLNYSLVFLIILNIIFFTRPHESFSLDSSIEENSELLCDIYEFEITNAGIPETSFRVLSSKGTYIRSLANDFGKVLNSGAYLKSLRRTRIGQYHIDDAFSIADLEAELIKMNSDH